MINKNNNIVFMLISTMIILLGGCASQQKTERVGKWIEANGVMLRYELTGNANDPVIVLSHDMGMNLEMWDEIVPAIQTGHRILRYDLRGFGLSEKFRGEVTSETYIADLKALLAALNINEPVIVMGQSIGGGISLGFATRYPELVKAVAVMNPVVSVTDKPAGPRRSPKDGTLRDTPRLFETEGVRAYLKSDAEWLYPERLRTPERWNKFVGIEVAQDPNNRAIIMRMAPKFVMDHELASIKVPTLVVAGLINTSMTEDDWKKIAAYLPNGKLVAIQSAHHAAYETPEMVTPLLRDFLKEHKL